MGEEDGPRKGVRNRGACGSLDERGSKEPETKEGGVRVLFWNWDHVVRWKKKRKNEDSCFRRSQRTFRNVPEKELRKRVKGVLYKVLMW